MVVREIGDDVAMEERGTGVTLCCPRCKSKDIEIKEAKEGYFWVYLCHSCGYKGKEGNGVGCIKKEDSKIEIEHDEYFS